MYGEERPAVSQEPQDDAGEETPGDAGAGRRDVVGDLVATMLAENPRAAKWLEDPEKAWMVTEHLSAFLAGVLKGWHGVEQPARAIGNDDAVQVRQRGVSCDLATALRLVRGDLVQLVGDEGVVEHLVVQVQALLGGVVTGMRVAAELRREDAGAGGGEEAPPAA